MKINEIEQNVKRSIPYEGIDRIIATLDKECGESLQAIKAAGSFLYRGIRVGGTTTSPTWKPRILQGNSPTIFKASSRTNRKPVDTPNQIQNMIDGALEATGFKALRSNSIFCSGYKAAAMNYGIPYLIFPLDGFDFTWSKAYADLYSDIIEDLESNEEHRELFFYRFEYDPGEWIFDIARYDNASLVTAIKSNHEIMIRGEYYAIHHQFQPVLDRFIFKSM
jgi:hypothetical protein